MMFESVEPPGAGAARAQISDGAVSGYDQQGFARAVGVSDQSIAGARVEIDAVSRDEM
jgi:hypothetical protein